MIFEIMNVSRVAEPCCTIFKVKTCLQFNCGYLHLPQVKSKHGFRLDVSLPLICCVCALLRCILGVSWYDTGELTFTKICHVRWGFEAQISHCYVFF